IIHRRTVMSTFNIKQTRKFGPGKFALIAVFAAFAAQAEAAGTATTLVDTQTKVGAVLSGARTELTVTQATSTSNAVDAQESTRKVLAGINSSGTDVRGTEASVASIRPSIGTNGRSSGEVQKLTQAIVLGRAAS